ncbi:hypothetical protein SEUCBS139899_008749 [Sporothrix eucalyptigena]|uniref:Uncharacterized protein n=1 Tax=Sporothrix eucalyptigena TaxID=1812306 RepID=A0ABP0B8T8_9PEZI
MLIPTLLQVATTLAGPTRQQDVPQNDVNTFINLADTPQERNIRPRLPDPSPFPAPMPYTSWYPNGQYSIPPVAAPPAVTPPAAAPPPAAPAAPTTAWQQQQPQPQPSPPPALVAPPAPAETQTWAQTPPAGGVPPLVPPHAGGPSPIIVGGKATVVLSPDKTVIVENPTVTLPPHGGGPPGSGADDAAAWTNVPPGWYATTYYACQGQGCAWHISIRPLSDSSGSGRKGLIGGSGMGQRLWTMAVYGMLTTVVMLVVG